MNPNPFLGVLLHAIGGFASASFYIPFRRVRHWAWETYWLVGGFFSWIIAPWVLAFLLVPDLLTHGEEGAIRVAWRSAGRWFEVVALATGELGCERREVVVHDPRAARALVAMPLTDRPDAPSRHCRSSRRIRTKTRAVPLATNGRTP